MTTFRADHMPVPLAALQKMRDIQIDDTAGIECLF
jgi:hypothetical protein